MNPEKRSELTVENLLALRKEHDAVRLITERLRVKEMGPADHIRTKHEVKAFVESGDEATARLLVSHASQRRGEQHSLNLKTSQRADIRMDA
jgi:hypothetical protein